ncbi:hypothetical protein OG948_36075 (plasmid) [Embleya sp. NBC_00888]|uniref:hypothetical protein n=1 Tax=Embleya sp. NBC_00888 TaxID=2975960 RepID=UPI002F90BB42|nr:hypothetical protein OG948_36075 [Embleya sp. NBC_00888]
MRNLPIGHRTRFSRAVATTTAVALGSVLMLSACSSGDSGKEKGDIASLGEKKGGSASGAPEAAAGEKGDMVKWAGCMRAHGVNVPDPRPDGSMDAGAPLEAGGGTAANDKMEAANAACTKWLPNGGVVSEKEKAAQRERTLKFARCMREHGIDVPDPQGDQDGVNLGFPGADQSKLPKALDACAKLQGGGE